MYFFQSKVIKLEVVMNLHENVITLVPSKELHAQGI